MANKERGELSVVVGGDTYTLRPTFDALCELEGLIDKPIEAVLEQVQQGRLSGLRAVIWCLLQEQHGGACRTLRDASRWIEMAGGADAALEMVYKVFQLNLDQAVEASAGGPPAPAQDAGTSPGSLSVPAESA